jgi:hypothetical protein
VLQLTPEGTDLFNAAVSDDPRIDYGCIVASVPRPRESLKLDEWLDPEYVALRALFRLLHGLTARPHPRCPYPKVGADSRRVLDAGLGFSRRRTGPMTASCPR